jgi:hypothetical protein
MNFLEQNLRGLLQNFNLLVLSSLQNVKRIMSADLFGSFNLNTLNQTY